MSDNDDFNNNIKELLSLREEDSTNLIFLKQVFIQLINKRNK